MGSEVIIVAAGVIAMAVTAVAWWLIFPVIFTLNEDPKCDASFNARAAVVCARTYDMMGMIPMVGIGGIILSLYARASRRQYDEVDESGGF